MSCNVGANYQTEVPKGRNNLFEISGRHDPVLHLFRRHQVPKSRAVNDVSGFTLCSSNELPGLGSFCPSSGSSLAFILAPEPDAFGHPIEESQALEPEPLKRMATALVEL